MLNIDFVNLLKNSSMLLGYFPDSHRPGKKDSQPPCFITVNLTYIDLLKAMTELTSILNQKFCDIDSKFGLHDYEIQLDLRNSRQSFFSETFRKVFTTQEQLEYGGRSSRSRQGGYAVFNLL